MSQELFVQVLLNGFMLAMVYTLLATGLTLVVGVLKVLQLAHGSIFMLAGFVVYYLVVEWGLSYWLSIPVAMLVGGGIGAIIERFLLRPFDYAIRPTVIITLGLSFMIAQGTLVGFGIKHRVVPSAISGLVQIFGGIISKERLFIVVASVVLMLALYYLIRFTKSGRAMRAVSQDRVAAALQGIDIHFISSMGIFIASALGAAAGALMAPVFSIAHDNGVLEMWGAFIAIVIGGMGSLPGALLGAFIVGGTLSFGAFFLTTPGAVVLLWGIFLLFIMFRPTGFFGHAPETH